MPFVFTAILFRIVYDRIRFERLEKEARAEHLSFQLKFLRSQVSPHFLFNMMSNMVSLARQKSDILEPSLIRLSELLRYMLYESQEEKISVTKEIGHLENYIELQKLRFEEDVKVELTVHDKCPDCLIEPMLLIPFIENAFKHGIGLLADAYIKVSIEASENKLQFHCVNNYNRDNLSKDKNSGIGLVNVKNRLQLLYPGKYMLTINDKEGIFSVHLNLNLS
jgi:LytS/YehU family sensor histidine kinase